MAVQRLCKVVTKWTTTHDAALVRLFAYPESAGPLALIIKLGPEDLQDVELVMWSDADWAGDADDTKSTFGFLVELINHKTSHCWPIS